MKQLYVIKQFFIFFFHVLFILWSGTLFIGCSIPHKKVKKQPMLLEKALSTVFLSCFSIQTSLKCIILNRIFHCNLEYYVTYDQQIYFILKGPLSIGIVRGLINAKGIMVLDRLYRVTYEWDYRKIMRDYHFYCNYPLLQSLLLGTPIYIKHKQGTVVPPTELSRYVTYAYDRTSGKVSNAQLIGKNTNYLKFSYRRKAPYTKVTDLLGMKIHFSLTNNGALHQGVIVCNKLNFRKLKRAKIKIADSHK